MASSSWALITEGSVELSKVIQENRLLGKIVHCLYTNVTCGIRDNFQIHNEGKVNNYEGIINVNCRQRRKLFTQKSQYTFGG
jgi:hypothetical protein